MTHAYAFWGALVAAVTLIAVTPAGAPRAAAAVYGAGLCALFGGSALYRGAHVQIAVRDPLLIEAHWLERGTI